MGSIPVEGTKKEGAGQVERLTPNELIPVRLRTRAQIYIFHA